MKDARGGAQGGAESAWVLDGHAFAHLTATPGFARARSLCPPYCPSGFNWAVSYGTNSTKLVPHLLEEDADVALLLGEAAGRGGRGLSHAAAMQGLLHGLGLVGFETHGACLVETICAAGRHELGGFPLFDPH